MNGADTNTRRPAIIELVDSDIRCLAPDGTLIATAGYAVLEKGGIATGDEALARAWLQPQQTFNHFWHQLNLAPLPTDSRHARHHADLAFAQLSRLFEALGQPGEILFAVPGSFSRDQLSVLLGLTAALPARAAGLVDAAVAAASHGPWTGEVHHLDIQLHQAVITRLAVDTTVERLALEVVPEAGLRALYNGWAQHIAELFIRTYRYDPLHAAEGEQQLFDRLPVWLARLRETPELEIELATPRGDFRLTLHRNSLLENAEHRFGKLATTLQRLGKVDHLLASHRAAGLPGLADYLGAAPLAADSAISGCLSTLEAICGDGESVDFVTRLPHRPGRAAGSAPAKAPTTGAREPSPEIPTHLLCGHQAYPLAPALGIDWRDGDVVFTRSSGAPVLVERRDGRIHISDNSKDGLAHASSAEPRCGDTLTVGDRRLLFIEVEPGT